MQRVPTLLVSGAALVLAPLVAAFSTSEAEAGSVEVMVLGTFHFANPGLDMVNTDVGDMLSEKRQAEMEELAQALAEFEPTKILLEMPPSSADGFNEGYRRFVDGNKVLGRNEHDQLGMRLAKELGHERLYGIDADLDLDLEGAFGHAAQNGQQELAQELGRIVAQIQETVGDLHAPDQTVAQMLRAHNSWTSGSDGGFYMVMAEVGDEGNPVGADVVAAWYQRNLRIFANLLRTLEDDDERVLVIYGSGHRALLEAFVNEHPDLTLVSALEYLPED